MVFQKNIRIGYELEAGFDRELRRTDDESNKAKEFYDLLKQLGFKCGGDGSISTSYYDLELKSTIYKVKNKDDLKKIFEDFEKISKYVKGVNSSCGIHIHISFEDLADYYTLLNFDFADNFAKKYEKKFKTTEELDRLTNSFCRKYYDEKEFKTITRKSLNCMGKGFRYYAINYNAFNLFKTIEFRIFASTKKPKKFQDYLTFLYDYVMTYLKENDDGLIKKDLIARQRKMTEAEDDEKIIINYCDIEEDAFKNYVDKQNEIKNQRETNEMTLRAKQSEEQRQETEEQRNFREFEEELNTPIIYNPDEENEEEHEDDNTNGCVCDECQARRRQNEAIEQRQREILNGVNN